MVTIQEYQLRRQRLAKHLPEQSVAVIPAGREVLRNGDSHYRFRQDSDFYYLTGFQEPEAVLVILTQPYCHSILFSRPRDPQAEQWCGKRLGQDDAVAVLGVDVAHPLSALETELSLLFSNKQHIVYPVGQDSAWDKRIIDTWMQTKKQLRSGLIVPEAIQDLAPVLSDMRLFKSPDEIVLMRAAADITIQAHQQAMRFCQKAQYEYELEAVLRHEFIRRGARSVAYDSIVAGGNNACTLHYTANDQPLVPGELVLIDAGAEFQCYAADVTRTFPINGKFSTEQRLIYDLVLRAQQIGIALIRPGTPWLAIQEAIVAVLTQGLVDLGILHGAVDDLIATQAYKPFYMHSSGHWLGLDVHDCGRYRVAGEWRVLEAGMVLTVEPGLYIAKNMPGIDKRWWGIGVRIEDDILVTADGHDNLTAALIRDSSDIEAFMHG
jgi:Xaa-Pro aminopeptidase